MEVSTSLNFVLAKGASLALIEQLIRTLSLLWMHIAGLRLQQPIVDMVRLSGNKNKLRGCEMKRSPEKAAPCEPVADQQKTELKKMLANLSSGMDMLVTETVLLLAQRGIEASELKPLMDLQRVVNSLKAAVPDDQASAPEHLAEKAAQEQPAAQAVPDFAFREASSREKRTGSVEASTNVLARASAIIDVMVQGGQTPEHSAQVITRQLLSVGIRLPEYGGDARAWKRLYQWRNTLIHHKRSGQAWDAYCSFREELASIPPDQRLRRAVGGRLWDLRQEDIATRDSA